MNTAVGRKYTTRFPQPPHSSHPRRVPICFIRRRGKNAIKVLVNWLKTEIKSEATVAIWEPPGFSITGLEKNLSATITPLSAAVNLLLRKLRLREEDDPAEGTGQVTAEQGLVPSLLTLSLSFPWRTQQGSGASKALWGHRSVKDQAGSNGKQLLPISGFVPLAWLPCRRQAQHFYHRRYLARVYWTSKWMEL